MTSTTRVRAGKAGERRRKPRSHPVPRWLKNGTELDAIARSRLLLLLSVLSGETPVTTAIGQAKISRATYYKLESRALNAMLAALNPLAGTSPDGRSDLAVASERIAGLEAKVTGLERDKRRAERLLLLTRKSLKGPVTTGRRGPWPKRGLRAGSTPTSPGASSP
jgi:hypothetical protein